MAIGQELLNVPMGDMIRDMAFAIADSQYQLDESSINVAEMMGGLTTVYDEEGNVSFDDSRVFFGYEYMTLPEAVAYAIMDDTITGALDKEEANSMLAMVRQVASLHDISLEGTGKDTKVPNEEGTVTGADGTQVPVKDLEIRMPTRLSMLELGFTPTFYQFVDTIIEVKIAIKITREREFTYTRSNRTADRANAYKRKRSFWRASRSSESSTSVSTSQVDATYSSKYSYSAEGASILRTKLVPVPVSSVLEERIRSFMETEEARREASLEARRAQSDSGNDTEN